jgi:hypothetical protein
MPTSVQQSANTWQTLWDVMRDYLAENNRLTTAEAKLAKVRALLMPEIESESSWIAMGHDIEITLHHVEAVELRELLK